MPRHTIILAGEEQRRLATHAIVRAPLGSVVTINPLGRTLSQSNYMWALLTDLSRQCPEGRRHTPQMWKAAVMHACGYEVQFMPGLSGEPFPIGYSSKELSKEQMSELIDFIQAYGAEHGVQFHTPRTMEDD